MLAMGLRLCGNALCNLEDEAEAFGYVCGCMCCNQRPLSVRREITRIYVVSSGAVVRRLNSTIDYSRLEVLTVRCGAICSELIYV